LFDLSNVEASQRKIEAYDAAQRAFEDLQKLSEDPRTRALIQELHAIDEQQLRPIDTRVLEND